MVFRCVYIYICMYVYYNVIVYGISFVNRSVCHGS